MKSWEIGPRLAGTLLGSSFLAALALVWSVYVWQNKQLELRQQQQEQYWRIQAQAWIQQHGDELLPALDRAPNPARRSQLMAQRERAIALMHASFPAPMAREISTQFCRQVRGESREAWCQAAQTGPGG